MPTTKRQIYDEAVCHIIQRGNNRQALFKEMEDFEKFLSLIREYKLIYPFELYNYCLMRNHIKIGTDVLFRYTLEYDKGGVTIDKGVRVGGRVFTLHT